jgi:hypothetical protein
MERAGLSKRLAAFPAPLAWAYAALAVMFGWVLFRSADLAPAVEVWRGMVGLNGAGGMGPALAAALQPAEAAVLAIGAFLALDPLGRRSRHRAMTTEVDDARGLETLAPPPRALASLDGSERRSLGLLRPLADWGATAAMLGLSLLQVSGGAFSPFLYFRF